MTRRLAALPMWFWLALAALLIVALAAIGIATRPSSGASSPGGLAGNADLDPGTPLSKLAPGFTLTDQFGRRISLHSFRGRVVILGFSDSQCTTICPLTTTAMVDAKRLLGPAGSQVQLLGINANPAATSIRDVRAYSEVHGMTHQWHFLTGSHSQLRRVWQAYKIETAIQRGQIDHTPALYVIDPAGRERKLYLTVLAYAAVSQLGQLLAQEAASLLPGHPRLRSSLSYSQIPGIGPRSSVNLPRAGGGRLKLGPSGSAHLYLFFATWDQQVTDLGSQLEGLNQYSAAAAGGRLPALAAVDEASVEPSPQALPRFLGRLSRPLAYPVVVDRNGRIADGYEVQDEPWYVLISPAGRFLWYYDISTGGWLRATQLISRVRAALTHAGQSPTNAAVARELAGSPAPLAALHQQAGRLLGGEPAFAARLRALRGYPVVVNAWASWCTPCREEFGLLASASARYGRQVAFLGADTDDSPGDALSFLVQHPVSYPSYQTTTSGLTPLSPIAGFPTTIYINRAGKVIHVHTGQYDALGTLNQDVATYALGG